MNHLIIAAIALVPVIATAQETSEVALVSSVFAELQPISFAKNVEY
ncbi:MAG: hypothetical protein ACJAXK_000435 [Yoonia sp.]|jgi:hypothetical protein